MRPLIRPNLPLHIFQIYAILFLKMKFSLRTAIIVFAAVGSSYIGPALAFDLKEKNEYLIDVRGDDGDIYLNRFSVYKKIEPVGLEISAFGETQWNFDINDWEKVLLGAETGRFFFGHLYLGQSAQFISGQIMDHMSFESDSHSFDSTTKIGLRFPFLKYFSLNISEEYSFSLEEGEYAEILADLNYAAQDLYCVGIGWRHTDRIHSFDSDYLSFSFTLNF